MTETEFVDLVSKLRERSNWSDYSEQILKRCWKGGFPITRLIDQKYGGRQMREICVGLETGVDIDQYADITISARRMQEIRESLPSSLLSVDNINTSNDAIDKKQTRAPKPVTIHPEKAVTHIPIIEEIPDVKEPLAIMAKRDKEASNADNDIVVQIDNETHWKDIELLESDLPGLTPNDFCRKAGISGADSVVIDKKDFESLKTAKAGVTISVSIRIRDHKYVLLADIIDAENLNAAQLEQICRAREAGLPYHLLVGFEADQMHEIRMGLLSLDQSAVELYAKNHFSANEMRYLRWVVSLGYESESVSVQDASAFALKKLTKDLPYFPLSVMRGIYDQDQIKLYISLWQEGLREVIPTLARLYLTTDQLREVRAGLLISRRAMSYAHPEFAPDQMRDMRLELEKTIGSRERVMRRLELSRNIKAQQKQVHELRSIHSK